MSCDVFNFFARSSELDEAQLDRLVKVTRLLTLTDEKMRELASLAVFELKSPSHEVSLSYKLDSSLLDPGLVAEQ